MAVRSGLASIFLSRVIANTISRYVGRGNDDDSKGPAHRGFTLVELVCVLVLVSIIGGVMVGRLFDTEAYDERITRDALLSVARAAQQLALSRSNVDLYIQDLGSELRVSARVDGTEETGRSFRKAEVQIRSDTSAAGGPAGNCSEISSPITIAFDLFGELSNATPGGTYMGGVPICLNGNVTSLCISAAGFAHSGSCV
jgi:MSHA pilin protein MshC